MSNFNTLINGECITKPNGNNFESFISTIKNIKTQTLPIVKGIKRIKAALAKITGNEELEAELRNSEQELQDNITTLKLLEYASLFHMTYVETKTADGIEIPVTSEMQQQRIARLNQLEQECGIQFIDGNIEGIIASYNNPEISKNPFPISREEFVEKMLAKATDNPKETLSHNIYSLGREETHPGQISYPEGFSTIAPKSLSMTCDLGDISMNGFFSQVMSGDKFIHWKENYKHDEYGALEINQVTKGL